jgi:hypothetical protein
MSTSHEHRLMLLEQQFKVLGKEVRDCMNAMYDNVQGLAKGQMTALTSLQAQVDDLRRHLGLPTLAEEVEQRFKAEGQQIAEHIDGVERPESVEL